MTYRRVFMIDRVLTMLCAVLSAIPNFLVGDGPLRLH